jgi:hypothetical protein
VKGTHTQGGHLMPTMTTSDDTHIYYKVYEKFPHGMGTTHADVINADLVAFIKR